MKTGLHYDEGYTLCMLQSAHVTRTGRGDPVTELCCPCGEEHKLWGEFWWVEGKHQWVFFDDLQTSETYGEQVEHCPACGRQLERKALHKLLSAGR